MKKKMNNKGFSLVELIIVVAIMAVLMVVLAPQLLRYVEKTRLQKDNSAISEIANAVEIACADEAVLNGTTFPVEITATRTTGNQVITFSGTDKLITELKATVGDSLTMSSTTYKNATGLLKIHVTNTSGTVSVTIDNFYSDKDTKEADGYKLK